MNPVIVQFTQRKALHCFPAVKKKRRAEPFLTSWHFFLKYRVNLKLIFHIAQFQPLLQLFPYARTSFTSWPVFLGCLKFRLKLSLLHRLLPAVYWALMMVDVHPGPVWSFRQWLPSMSNETWESN